MMFFFKKQQQQTFKLKKYYMEKIKNVLYHPFKRI